MSDFFALLKPISALDRQAVQRLARHSCLDIHRVTWLRCYLSTDGLKLLCWYQANDAESVRFVLRQQGSADTVVSPAEITDGGEPGAPASEGECFCLEFEKDSPVAAGPAPAGNAVLAMLERAGLVGSRVFASRDGARLLVIVDRPELGELAACLASVGLKPDAIWPCHEIDPDPSQLFNAPEFKPDREQILPGAGVGGSTDFDAIIVGAGMAGICALQRLANSGLNVRVYESASEIGGVWYWNRYPGARVDSEVYTYGFSFSEDLLDHWEWRELFAPQPELMRYLQHVVERFHLREHICLNSRVASATYDQPGNRWSLQISNGERVTARFLIAATGSLSAPQMPDWPGIETFSGERHHTARWPLEGVELADKRVGVVGTGASGVQVIQTIADTVRHLTVFQRTPTYCIPQRNRLLSHEERQQVRQDWPGILAACRQSYSGFLHNFDPRSGLAVTAAEREAKFEELWQTPGLAFWFGNFADLMMNDEVNAHACEFLRNKIRARVVDPRIAEKLLPDHPFGCKRIPLENGYYEVYNRANVSLVDLRDTPIEQVTRNGVRTSQGNLPLDVMICATGFDAGTGALTRIDIRGEGGLTIAEKWRDGPRTYLGLCVAGFPNLLMVNGPHNAAALCNAGRCIEQNVDWIARCLDYMRKAGATRIAADFAAEEAWTAHVHDTAAGTVLAKMTNSWFFGANTPGKARRVTIYAGGARLYREHCEQVAQADYPGLVFA